MPDCGHNCEICEGVNPDLEKYIENYELNHEQQERVLQDHSEEVLGCLKKFSAINRRTLQEIFVEFYQDEIEREWSEQ